MSAEWSASSEAEAWDEFFDTQALRCCDCPACNSYLPHDKAEAERLGVPAYDPEATCVVVAAVLRIIDARLANVEESA